MFRSGLGNAMAVTEKHGKGAKNGKPLHRPPHPDRRPAGDGDPIDLDRLVYDPEYRAEIRRQLNRRQADGEG